MNDHLCNLLPLDPARQGRDTAAHGESEDGDLCARPALGVSGCDKDVSATCSGECGNMRGPREMACQGEVIHRGSHWTAYAKECIGCERLER
jgi:hypothetical protein